MELQDVFYAHARRQDGCWTWVGSTDKDGYGVLKWRQRQYRAPRVSFFLDNGHWPEPVVRHTCDNPPCTNPSHLVEGSHRQNSLDGVERGRITPPVPRLSGEQNGRSVLTSQQVDAIRERYAAGGVRQVDLAGEYGVTQTTISKIVRRDRW